MADVEGARKTRNYGNESVSILPNCQGKLCKIIADHYVDVYRF